MIRGFISLAGMLLIAGCSGAAGRGPSLLPRTAEQQTFDEPAAGPAAVAAPDAALDGRITDLVTQRITASTEFAAADQRVAVQLRAGARAAVGSDAWLDAQTAIGALDAERASILRVLTDLDALASARVAGGQPSYPALDAARAETEAELDRVTAIVTARKTALPL